MRNTWKRGAELKLKNPFKLTILTFATTNFNLKKNSNLKTNPEFAEKTSSYPSQMEMTITTRN